MNTTIETTQQKINIESLKQTDINIVVLGHGLVGSALIKQILEKQESLLRNKDLNLKIIAVANSTRVLFAFNGIKGNWQTEKESSGTLYTVSAILDFVGINKFNNLILVDNTADDAIVNEYINFINAGFHLVSSNKKGNTQSLDCYHNLRAELHINNKKYLYETNVGAGLPLIDTIALLHASGENITKIRGVFSMSFQKGIYHLVQF
jgi:aspartokinase/homoserine dehydrogenase 1